ncbi:hypothetical protein B0T20DRAFT_223598 [Sordaria brevicollis]|uniref:Uncharacterized protein n=1 Tax=Sordaria brevicollis TaxID=83679 RepID=A0AAE0PD13_SORBR|nr:hypothetical protein B0T20DRAFT_223598 [Sordaria brevicollis]
MPPKVIDWPEWRFWTQETQKNNRRNRRTAGNFENWKSTAGPHNLEKCRSLPYVARASGISRLTTASQKKLCGRTCDLPSDKPVMSFAAFSQPPKTPFSFIVEFVVLPVTTAASAAPGSPLTSVKSGKWGNEKVSAAQVTFLRGFEFRSQVSTTDSEWMEPGRGFRCLEAQKAVKKWGKRRRPSGSMPMLATRPSGQESQLPRRARRGAVLSPGLDKNSQNIDMVCAHATQKGQTRTRTGVAVEPHNSVTFSVGQLGSRWNGSEKWKLAISAYENHPLQSSTIPNPSVN